MNDAARKCLDMSLVLCETAVVAITIFPARHCVFRCLLTRVSSDVARSSSQMLASDAKLPQFNRASGGTVPAA